jgi:hypothetical protein
LRPKSEIHGDLCESGTGKPDQVSGGEIETAPAIRTPEFPRHPDDELFVHGFSQNDKSSAVEPLAQVSRWPIARDSLSRPEGYQKAHERRGIEVAGKQPLIDQ